MIAKVLSLSSFGKRAEPPEPPKFCYTAIRQGKALSFIVPFSDRQTFQGMPMISWMLPEPEAN